LSRYRTSRGSRGVRPAGQTTGYRRAMIERALEVFGPEDLRQLQANGVPESKHSNTNNCCPVELTAIAKNSLGTCRGSRMPSWGSRLRSNQSARGRESDRDTGRRSTAWPMSTRTRKGFVSSMLRDGIAPRLSNVRLRWVPGFPQGPVLIIRVAQSANSTSRNNTLSRSKAVGWFTPRRRPRSAGIAISSGAEAAVE
jgi:hypothetical protein